MDFLTNLRAKTDQEKTVIAGTLAIALMILLLFVWGVLFFSSTNTNTQDTGRVGGDTQQSASANAATQPEVSDELTALMDKLRESGELDSDTAAANFVRLYLDGTGDIQTEQAAQ